MDKKIVKKIKSIESNISMFLGILVIVAVGFLLFKYFRNLAAKPKQISNEAETLAPNATPIEEKKERFTEILPTKYIVQQNDHLWKISAQFYGYGFNWVDIARENKINNPDKIFISQQLTIPNVPVRKPISANTSKEQTATGAKTKTINGGNYEVVNNDTLWNISVRAYQDGFKWPEIAKANRLTNPDLIHPGNTLIIPR